MVWPHGYSDLKADPAVRFGNLPNGIGYAILKNETPAGQVALRLRIGSGSLQESDAQQGLAHLLEHMAFKGSTNVPEGELVRILQRKGLAFGPDTNAFTSATQTTYVLDLPERDLDTIETGLMLLREIASELTLRAAAMETERGVVLSEERWRDTPKYRAYAARLGLLLEGQLAARRLPIGKVEVLQSASVDLVREYYESNYRPENATLLAIGDFDPSVIENKIRAFFGDWQAPGTEAPDPDLGEIKRRTLQARFVELPGAETKIEIAWIRPFEGAQDSKDKRRSDLVNRLGLAVLKRRFAKLARSETPPFLGANATFDNLLRSAKVASVIAASTPEGWPQSLAALDEEQRRIVRFGIRQDELDQAIAEFRKSYDNAAVSAGTRRTKDLARSLIASIDQDFVFTSPADNLERFESSVDGLTVAEVNAALSRIFEGEGPLVLLTGTVSLEGGDEALAEEYRKSHAAEVEAPAPEAVMQWTYGIFGGPGSVIERREISDLGASAFTFANGVRLTVKPTRFRAGDVLVRARIGNGRLDMPAESSVWLTGAFTGGGLSAIGEQDMARVLASKVYAAQLRVIDDAFLLDGRTRPQDLDAQLQVLAAYVSDPAYRPEAIERTRARKLAHLLQLEATPAGVEARDCARLLRGNDPRWGEPSREEVEAAKAEALRALMDRPLSRGAIEVTIIGDITPEAALEAVAATFGALSPRPASSLLNSSANVRFPATRNSPVQLTHKGRANSALAYLAWSAQDFFADMRGSRALILAADVLRNRLMDQVRVAEGATYSVQAGAFLSDSLAGYGYAWTKVETSPEKIARFYDNVSRITGDMAQNGVSADELSRAKTPKIESLKKAQLSNEHWLQTLSGTHADPRRLEMARTRIAGYEDVTAEDIRSAVADYLTDDRAWRLVVLPSSH